MDKRTFGPNTIFRACVLLALGDPRTPLGRRGDDEDSIFMTDAKAERLVTAPDAWRLVLETVHARRGDLYEPGNDFGARVRGAFRSEALSIFDSLPVTTFTVAGQPRKGLHLVTSWDMNGVGLAAQEQVRKKVPMHELCGIVHDGGYTLRVRAGSVTTNGVTIETPVLDVIGAQGEKRPVVSFYVSKGALGMGVNLLDVSNFEPVSLMPSKKHPGYSFDVRDVRYTGEDRSITVGDMIVSGGGRSEQVAYFAVDSFVNGVTAAHDWKFSVKGAVATFIKRHLPDAGGFTPLTSLTGLRKIAFEKLKAVALDDAFLLFDVTPHGYKEVLW